MKVIYGKVNQIFKRIDESHLEILGIGLIVVLLIPIFILGKGAVFPFIDQLDETIMNYVLSARFFGEETCEAMMNGVRMEGLKPFAPFFLPLYFVFEPFTAFLIQYILVLCTAFFGAYLCIREITKSSVAAFLASSMFTMLPFRSVYGNCLAGTPLLIFCILKMVKGGKEKKKYILPAIGIMYYAASTSLVLCGYAAIILYFGFICFYIIKHKKIEINVLFPIILLSVVYVLLNIDLVKEILVPANSFISHRTEFSMDRGDKSVLSYLKEVLVAGIDLNESWHKFIYIAALVAGILVLVNRNSKKYTKAFVCICVSILVLALLYAVLSGRTAYEIKSHFPTAVKSFQFQRFYYFLPGLWYILLGISLAIIIAAVKEYSYLLAYAAAFICFIPTLFYVGKNENSIFYNNVNQINNAAITGYITWENLYSEDLMEEIDKAIGMDKKDYRVVSLGMCPVVSLMHGFYTVDGYSNNYSLDYKHKFRDVIQRELDKNEYINVYFNEWGNRCYMFFHEWGNAFMLRKAHDVTITDLEYDFDKLSDLGCRYIFSAVTIGDYEKYGLKHLGLFSSEKSYWDINVYELP